MLNPLDGWTIPHGIVGFLSGKIGINRWVFYPFSFGWEVYQLYFHYQPQGHDLEYVWINSMVDIIACVLGYEISRIHQVRYDLYPYWFKVSLKANGFVAYSLISFGITWLFWDDIFRIGPSEQIPLPQIPILLGLISPAIAAFIVRTWIIRE
jgi:hypothetical protein